MLLDGAVVGHSPHFRKELVAAMTVVDALLSRPADFAWLLAESRRRRPGGVVAERLAKR